jgi:hypothetical protein
MPHLAPDFAYIHHAPSYETAHFFQAYDAADRHTAGFNRVTETDLVEAMTESPETLLVFRTLLGLTKEEFAHSTLLAGGPVNLEPLSSSQIDKMERQTAVAAAPSQTRAPRLPEPFDKR